MAFVITDACRGVKDTACVDVCPVDCIHPTPDEPDFEQAEQLYINPDQCIDCGLCVDECPVGAIHQEDDLLPEHEHFIQLNLEWFERNGSGSRQAW